MKTPLTILVIIIFSLNNAIGQNQKVVPDEFLTIQEAIDAAINGDTVVVKPGIYYGVIDFKGKEILVTSLYRLTNDTSYIASTILTQHPTDNSFPMRRAARFKNGETENSELSGFSIKDFPSINCCGEGVIEVVDASPKLSHLRISNVRGTGAIAISANMTTQNSLPIVLEAVQITNCEVPLLSSNANFSIVNCKITKCSSGLTINWSRRLIMFNSLIDGNWRNGGLNFTGISLVLGNTISRTSIAYHGVIPPAISATADSLIIRSSIVNSLSASISDFIDTLGFVTNANPMYYMNEFNFSQLEYKPSRYSPGINKGVADITIDQEVLHAPDKDIDGMDRSWKPDNAIDIGPYEYFDDDNTTYSPPTVNLSSSKQYICEGDNFSITASPAVYNNYSWTWQGTFHSETTAPSILVNNSGIFKVVVHDEIGATASDEISISQAYPFPNRELCTVTVDSSNNVNKLIWRPTAGIGIKAYIIYRETNVTNQVVALDTIPFNEAGVYYDYQSNPGQVSYRYRIKVITDCDEIKGAEDFRESIHAYGFSGANNEFTLFWVPDESVGVLGYKILRGRNKNEMQTIGEMAGSATSLTDLDPSPISQFYMIQAKIETACADYTSEQESHFEENIFSNVVTRNVVVGIDGENDFQFNIYPNPIHNSFTITDSNFISNVNILDLAGRIRLTVLVKKESRSVEIERGGLSSGLYIIDVECVRERHRQKISIN